uniref:BESS domain-containing protein n=1 Tax=Romanomermis culicivorax TaxID=13658 RepID=A0A915I7H0_ROMCU
MSIRRKLSNDEKFKLIELVREKELLWNVESPDYKDVRKKHRIDLAAEFGILRSSYNRHCKKMKTKNSYDKPNAIWKFYDAMTFLDTIPLLRQTVTNTPPMESRDEAEDPTFAKDQPLQDVWDTKSDLTETTPTNDHPVKKFKLDDALLKSSSEILQHLGSIQPIQDDDDYFGLFLSATLKRLPRIVKARIKRDVMNLLYDAEVDCTQFEAAGTHSLSDAQPRMNNILEVNESGSNRIYDLMYLRETLGYFVDQIKLIDLKSKNRICSEKNSLAKYEPTLGMLGVFNFLRIFKGNAEHILTLEKPCPIFRYKIENFSRRDFQEDSKHLQQLTET